MLYTEKKNDTHAPKHNDNKTEQERIVLKTNKLHLHCTALSCLLYTSPSPRDPVSSRMPSSA